MNTLTDLWISEVKKIYTKNSKYYCLKRKTRFSVWCCCFFFSLLVCRLSLFLSLNCCHFVPLSSLSAKPHCRIGTSDQNSEEQIIQDQRRSNFWRNSPYFTSLLHDLRMIQHSVYCLLFLRSSVIKVYNIIGGQLYLFSVAWGYWNSSMKTSQQKILSISR